jgi:hypothetical protein
MTEMSISYHLLLPREQCVVQVHAEWSIPRKEGSKQARVAFGRNIKYIFLENGIPCRMIWFGYGVRCFP